MKTKKPVIQYQIYDNETGRAYMEPMTTIEGAEYMAKFYGPKTYIIVEIENEAGE